MFEDLSDVELKTKWIEAIGKYRYFDACDCQRSWEIEEKARKQNAILVESLEQEFKKRGTIPARVP